MTALTDRLSCLVLFCFFSVLPEPVTFRAVFKSYTFQFDDDNFLFYVHVLAKGIQ